MPIFILSIKGVFTLPNVLDSSGHAHCLLDIRPVQNIQVNVIPNIRKTLKKSQDQISLGTLHLSDIKYALLLHWCPTK
jgi:hypothetical protein